MELSRSAATAEARTEQENAKILTLDDIKEVDPPPFGNLTDVTTSMGLLLPIIWGAYDTESPLAKLAQGELRRLSTERISKRQFLKLGGAIIAESILFGPRFVSEWLEHSGVLSGITKRTASRYPLNILLAEYVQHYAVEFADKFPFDLGYSVQEKVISEEDSYLTIATHRGDNIIGNLYLSIHRRRVPVAVTPPVLSQGLLACSQTFLQRVLSRMNIDSVVAAGGWVGHQAVTYAQALLLDVLEHQFQVKMSQWVSSPPGGGNNEWREWGPYTSTLFMSQSDGLNRFQFERNIVPAPDTDTRGYRGVRGEHLLFRVDSHGNWKASVVFKSDLEGLVLGRNEDRWSVFKPLILLSHDNYRSERWSHTEKISFSGMYVAVDSQGNDVFGFLSSDQTVRGTIVELYETIDRILNEEGLELKFYAGCDGGGSTGITSAAKVHSNFGHSNGNSITFGQHSNPTYAHSAVLGAKASLIYSLMRVFPISHTSANFLVGVDRSNADVIFEINALGF